MADQGGSPNEGIVGMFDSRSQDAQAPDWQAVGQQAVTAIPNNISGLGGGWSLSESQLQSVIQRLQALEHEIYRRYRDARPMIEIEPSADEGHSIAVAKAMNRSGQAYLDSLNGQLGYVKSLRESMQGTLDSYRGVERGNAETVASVNHAEGTVL